MSEKPTDWKERGHNEGQEGKPHNPPNDGLIDRAFLNSEKDWQKNQDYTEGWREGRENRKNTKD